MATRIREVEKWRPGRIRRDMYPASIDSIQLCFGHSRQVHSNIFKGETHGVKYVN